MYMYTCNFEITLMPFLLPQKSVMEVFVSIPLVTASARSMTIREAKHDNGFQVRGDYSHDEAVQLYKAVMAMGKNSALINISDYILSFDHDGEVVALMHENELNSNR